MVLFLFSFSACSLELHPRRALLFRNVQWLPFASYNEFLIAIRSYDFNVFILLLHSYPRTIIRNVHKYIGIMQERVYHNDTDINKTYYDSVSCELK